MLPTLNTSNLLFEACSTNSKFQEAPRTKKALCTARGTPPAILLRQSLSGRVYLGLGVREFFGSFLGSLKAMGVET